jgi:glycosyltransferase involved in cell wall biosynthesis
LVGWQWYTRMRAEHQIKTITCKVFDAPEFLDANTRCDIRFVDTHPTYMDEINTRPLLHAYRFWRGARKILAAECQSNDCVVIVSPAAVWFMPFIFGLPIHRSRVYYGPVGPVLLASNRANLSQRVRTFIRNSLTVSVCIVWRALSTWLPKNVSLRFPAPWFHQLIGPSYEMNHVIPEVELPFHDSLEIKHSALPASTLAILFDDRLRKNFTGNVTHGIRTAVSESLELVIVGAPEELKSGLERQALAAGCRLSFLERMARHDFVNWLKSFKPTLINLSYSEGVPSTLIEALCSGCEIHTYNTGGIHWLIKFARSATPYLGDPQVIKITWDSDSAAKYSAYVGNTYESLLATISKR